MTEEELLELLNEEKQKGDKKINKEPKSARRPENTDIENLEKIGSSILSGLASITSISADALSEIAENRKNSKSPKTEVKRREIENRRRQAEIVKAKREVEKQKRKEKARIKSISFIVALFFMLLYVTIFGDSPFGWISIFVALGTYNASKRLLPNILSKSETPRGSELDTDNKNKSLPRTDEELFLEIIDRVNYKLDNIYNNMRKTKDTEIKTLMSNVYERGLDITEYLKNNPEKITISRRFLNYYLDTASKISKNYVDFENKRLRENDEHIKEETKKALIMLETAFDKEFFKLVENDLVDFEADIKVLEESMKWDNYYK